MTNGKFQVKLTNEFEHYSNCSNLIFNFDDDIEKATQFMKDIMCHLDCCESGKIRVTIEKCGDNVIDYSEKEIKDND